MKDGNAQSGVGRCSKVTYDNESQRHECIAVGDHDKHEFVASDEFPIEGGENEEKRSPPTGLLSQARQPAGLLPCPWCQQSPELFSNHGKWRVRCTQLWCLVNPQTVYIEERHKAISKWNSRTPSSIASDIEQCSYCKEWYPKPVSLHHSDDECDLNVSEHSADAAPCPVCKFHWDMEVYSGQPHNPNCPHATTQPEDDRQNHNRGKPESGV